MADNRDKRGKNGGQERHERRVLTSEQAGQNAGFIVWIMKEIAEIVNSVPKLELVEPKTIEPTGGDWWRGDLIVSGWQRTDFYEQCKPLAYELGSRLGVDIVLQTHIVTDSRLARIMAFVKKVAEKFAGSEVQVTSTFFRRREEEGAKDAPLALGFYLETVDSDSKGRLVGTGGKNARALRAALRYLVGGIGLSGGAEVDIQVKRKSAPVAKSQTGTVGEDPSDPAKPTGSTSTSAGE